MRHDGRLDPASLFRGHACPRHDQHGRAPLRSVAALRSLRRSGRDRALRGRGLGVSPATRSAGRWRSPMPRRSRPTCASCGNRSTRCFAGRRPDEPLDASALAAFLRACADGARRQRRNCSASADAPFGEAGAPLPFEAALAVSALSLLDGGQSQEAEGLSELHLAVSRQKPQFQPLVVRYGGLRKPRQGKASLSPSKACKGRKPMARKLLLPVIGLLLAGAALGACRDEGGKGEYFAISGKLFEFNYRLAKATYIVTLNPLQPMDGSQVAVATFEDPAGGEPLVIRQKIWPKLPPCDAGEPAADLRRQGQALRGVDQHRGRRRLGGAEARHHDHLVARPVDPAGPARWSSARSTSSTRIWRAIRTGACPTSRSRTARPRCRQRPSTQARMRPADVEARRRAEDFCAK